MAHGLMPIGRFASLCRLSVKQLRHYDDIGLLRSLDVPLPAIGQVLGGQDVAGVLGGVRDQLEADLTRRRRMLHTLDRVLSDGLPRAEVQLVRQEASKVLVTRGAGALAEVAAVTSDCVGRLVAALEAARAKLTGPLVALFPLDLADTLTVTATAQVAETVPGLAEDVLSGGRFAMATHIGPYDQISLTSHAVLAWASEHGHTPRGPLREVYLSDPRHSAPEQLVTQGNDQTRGGRVNNWYTAADSPELVEFDTVRGLGVTGIGEPGGTEHLSATQALYAVAGTLLRAAPPALEGRWWVEDDRPPLTVPRAEWR